MKVFVQQHVNWPQFAINVLKYAKPVMTPFDYMSPEDLQTAEKGYPTNTA